MTYLDPWSGAVAAMTARLAQAASLTNGAQVVEYHEIHSLAQGKADSDSSDFTDAKPALSREKEPTK